MQYWVVSASWVIQIKMKAGEMLGERKALQHPQQFSEWKCAGDFSEPWQEKNSENTGAKMSFSGDGTPQSY